MQHENTCPCFNLIDSTAARAQLFLQPYSLLEYFYKQQILELCPAGFDSLGTVHAVILLTEYRQMKASFLSNIKLTASVRLPNGSLHVCKHKPEYYEIPPTFALGSRTASST
jgi:hypothetical protein